MSGGISLNLVTIRPARFEQKLHIARAAGYDAVGLSLDEMAREKEEGVRELRLSEMPVSEVVGLSGWMEQDRATRLVAAARAEEVFEFAASIGCRLVTAWPTGGPVETLTAAGRFADLCRLAAPFGVAVGLEFVGSHEQVNDLASAWEIVELSEASNGGLVIDTFHFHRGGSEVAMLEPVPADKILLVQVSDCVDLPRHELEDRHRVYPGTGAIPLEALLGALREKGYAGYYSLELQNEEYWAEDPLIVAREGMRAMRRLDIT